MGQESPANLVAFIVDNGVYESIGSTKGVPRPTATAGKTDLAALALGSGVPYAVNVETSEALEKEMGLVRTKPGYARVPPRQSDGFENKYRFVRHVEQLEKIQIINVARQDRQLMKK
jgi:hypothetical protein